MDHIYLFVVASLGVWRITHLVSSEDGPWRCFARLRAALAGRVWAGLVECFYCLSVWVSLPFAVSISGDLREQVLLWPALSGAAMLLERVTDRAMSPAASASPSLPTTPTASDPAEYFEHGGEQDHVVLRKEH